MNKKILIIGDSPTTPTGFSSVVFGIFKYLTRKFDISQIGVNYYGDPHTIPWPIYPASIQGDLWGYGRLAEIPERMKPDLIFILNDVWVIRNYLEGLKKVYTNKPMPPIVVYFPVDSMEFDVDWFKDFDIVTQSVVYTKFGYNVCKLVRPNIEFKIVPHGVDVESFYKIDADKETIRRSLYPPKPEFYEDSFIVLNANRNQPRKKVDVTLNAFALFAEGKPENVKIHMHMGLKDAAFDILKMARRFGMDDRLIVTSVDQGPQRVSVKKLNTIYNATDVGINTSSGEGWGLCSVEHAVTGAVQIVPKHSACLELFEDCGILVPVSYWNRSHEQATLAGYVSAEDAAQAIEYAYQHRTEDLGKAGMEKFISAKYSWQYVSKKFEDIFKACLH